MAQILDKQGLQHYANKMCNADNRKVGSKNLPTALNEIDTAIDGFKTLFESEYGTPVNMELENNENVFSIGTGTNIDKKDDVENSFTDVELSGNSLVNLCPQTYNFTTVTTKGEAILDGLDVTYNSPTYRIKAFTLTQPLKPNTTYTAIVNILSLVNSDAVASYVKYSDGEVLYNQFSATQLGLNIKKFTTSNKIATELAYYLNGGECSAKISGVIILEGDWTNKPLPQYFEGLKSIGEKEDGNHKISISSVGKNLFEPTVSQKSSSITANTQYSIENNGYSISISSSVNRPTTETASHIHFGEVKLKIGETYVVSADKMIKDTNTAIPQIRIAYWDKQNNRYATIGYLTNHTSVFTFTVESGKEYVALGLYSHGALLTNGQTVKATYEGVRLYLKSTSNTSYEPHKSDKKEISLNEPLRGLPNGIRDTIEKINGEWKIVRRCGEIVLDGSEYWSKYTPNETSSCFGHVIDDIATKYQYGLVCDRFASAKDYYPNSVTDEGINQHGNKVLLIRINHSRLSSQDVAGFKQWLSQNPTKVIYELETPIIENISPVTLQCWKNGTISIDEVLPVESTHTVALNKSAQIQKNIEELSILKNRIETLEKQYNNSTLNQAYELELLRLDMQLDNII